MMKLSQLNVAATYSDDADPGSVDLTIEINGADSMRQTVARDTVMAAIGAVVDPLPASVANDDHQLLDFGTATIYARANDRGMSAVFDDDDTISETTYMNRVDNGYYDEP